MAIDFVVHGDMGVAGPWAAAAQAGDGPAVKGPGAATTGPGVPTGTCSSATSRPCRRSPRRWWRCPPTPVVRVVRLEVEARPGAAAAGARARRAALAASGRGCCGRGPARGASAPGLAARVACTPSCTARPPRGDARPRPHPPPRARPGPGAGVGSPATGARAVPRRASGTGPPAGGGGRTPGPTGPDATRSRGPPCAPPEESSCRSRREASLSGDVRRAAGVFCVLFALRVAFFGVTPSPLGLSMMALLC